MGGFDICGQLIHLFLGEPANFRDQVFHHYFLPLGAFFFPARALAAAFFPAGVYG